MAQQENKIPLSKKGQREISQFIGHELLYDYLCGNLDKERQAAVEDHVKFSRDAQLDLDRIQSGQAYAESLSSTVVSQPIVSQVSAPTSYFYILLQKSHFDKWPQGLKWGLEALMVVLVIVTALTVTPWQKMMELGTGTGSKEVVLAEVSRTEQVPVSEEKPEFVDEDVKEKDKTPPPVVAEKKTETAQQAVAEPAAAQEEKTSPESSTPAISGGFLYRGDIAVTNVEVVSVKITEKIAELGGRKAGSVELGWRKTPTSSYYHFTIPEAKYQDLVAFLSTYGKPKISKEKHPRVMPDGIVRLIITVDEEKK